jgi:hypothetical protein
MRTTIMFLGVTTQETNHVDFGNWVMMVGHGVLESLPHRPKNDFRNWNTTALFSLFRKRKTRVVVCCELSIFETSSSKSRLAIIVHFA